MKNIKSSALKKVAVSLVIASLLLTGCSTVKGIFGKAITEEQKSANKIELVKTEISQNTDDQLSEISGLVFGVDYALRQSTNEEPALDVAGELNTRTLNVAGLPPLLEQKKMANLVDDLLNPALLKDGSNLLLQKDQEIISLQEQKKELLANKDKAIANYMTLANSTALKTDTLSSKLASYTSYWGLGGVALGIWSFGKHIFWVLLVGGIGYIILRLLSMTNPTVRSYI